MDAGAFAAGMNICLVSQFYPPETGGGGIASYLAELASALVERGHRVFVISKSTTRQANVKMQGPARVFRVPQWSPQYLVSRIPLVGQHVRALRDLAYSLTVRRQIEVLARQVTLDIVEYADIEAEGFLHPRHSRIPYVIKLHTPHVVLDDYYTPAERGYSTVLINWMERMAIGRASALACPSHALANEIVKRYGISRQRIRYIPNGIDTRKFSPNGKALSAELSTLFVGRLERLKGATVLAHAIPKIAAAQPSANFVLAGPDRTSPTGGSQMEEILAYLNHRGVAGRVVFTGPADSASLRGYYHRAAVSVVPSLFENCPYAVLEAMAYGIPVVASDNSGLAEIIEDGKNGLLFETGNPESLANQVIRLLSSRLLRAEIGRAGRFTVESRYDARLVAEQTERLYVSVTGGGATT